MYVRFFSSLALIASCAVHSTEYTQQSITGNIPTYLESCIRAVEDPVYFQTFRSHPEYAPILECRHEKELARYLVKNGSGRVWEKLELCRKLDQYGNPIIANTQKLGPFSGTTLRYIVIADQIAKLFNLPSQPVIAEIGAGFGGQCYIFSLLIPFSTYFIFDLAEPELLIKKMMDTLSVSNAVLLDAKGFLPVEKVDLLLSNYAFSECNRETQLDYFERVVKQADRGYMIFNHISHFDSLSSQELVELLEKNQMNPKIYPEPVFTYPGNLLITWDKTKNK